MPYTKKLCIVVPSEHFRCEISMSRNIKWADTFNPGIFPYHAAKHCECCAATPAAAPFGPLKTIGTWT